VTGEAHARSPLEDRADELAAIGARELPFLAQVSLRLEVREALGPHPVLPPTAPNTWTTIEGRELLWLGPDEWLVVDDPGREAEIVRWLDEAFAGLHRSVVGVSSNRIALELEGGDRLDLLAAGCGLDLHPRSWRDGRCAQTLVGRIPVLLQERAAATRVFVRPSLAGALADWLLAVADR
jgi:sarcosine oxidase subunit gamma